MALCCLLISYIGQEFPLELPLQLRNVTMSFETMPMNDHYSQTGFSAWLEWHAINHFLKAHGFFGTSMFHQLHCLEMIQESMINGLDGHAAHCLNFLRQAILYNSDITLESGGESTHVCRD
ncbi:hypothetical protein WOLCODRAFT_133473 [Wolfiporia cocos MD-104 SS10]|uniref:Uncharacterized protein n=1 Tax=Wolfiporia cocos (strain MD-104) TaxID=742152 RepID=A0A2H3JSE0_WOLCO|nr:hypothetical protein WOLCODRAFT_133473 [Wolfiporia cocos MD-104 SS10]